MTADLKRKLNKVLAVWDALPEFDKERLRSAVLEIVSEGRPTVMNVGVPGCPSVIHYLASSELVPVHGTGAKYGPPKAYRPLEGRFTVVQVHHTSFVGVVKEPS